MKVADANYVWKSSVTNNEENAMTDDSEGGLYTDMVIPSCTPANPSERDQPINCDAAKFILKAVEGQKLTQTTMLPS